MHHEHAEINTVENWLVDMADGHANPAETERVRRLLAHDPILRRHFALRLIDESLIREELQIAEAEILLSDQLVLPGPFRQDKTVKRSWRGRLGYAIVACVAASVLGWFVGRQAMPKSEVPSTIQPEEELAAAPTDTDGFAVLTQAINVEWATGSTPLQIRDRIASRTLRISRGFLQIEFFGGATAVVEGPADFDIVSESRIRCRAGKVRITVPPQSVGLTVSTSDLDLVDLGTEFAVQIGKDGAGEVHVFSGKVDIRLAGGQSLQMVERGTAVGFTQQGGLKPATADGDNFVGIERLKTIRSASEAAGLCRWREHSRLWVQDTAMAMYFTFDGQNDFDRQLTGHVAAKPASVDGAIVGCRWTTGRYDGKGALDFKGSSDRVKVRVDDPFNSMSLFVSLRVGGFDRRLSSLLLADGYAPGKVHWQLTDGGSLRFSVSGGGAHKAPRVIQPGSLGKWIQLATVYDHEAKTITHYVDGEPVASDPFVAAGPLYIGRAEVGNWNPLGVQANSIRSLNGTIDEMAVFRRALSGAEIRQAYQAGKP